MNEQISYLLTQLDQETDLTAIKQIIAELKILRVLREDAIKQLQLTFS